ncbi:hypothetical protein scyTo_0025616 [Scyliorhinus torazame]|uniref:Uncharacterized protein n=1 Tax=Scyliorhinus torazame TaxID=75743 RepID=A0A401QI11_SCYTO|nr:hypothetical protein [Scyliorhinus torazame]
MNGGGKTFTKRSSKRAPTLVILCEWVVEPWDEIRMEIVIQSFRKSGNTVDGTEDDYLWNIADDEVIADEDDVDPDDDAIEEADWDVLSEEEGEVIFMDFNPRSVHVLLLRRNLF